MNGFWGTQAFRLGTRFEVAILSRLRMPSTHRPPQSTAPCRGGEVNGLMSSAREPDRCAGGRSEPTSQRASGMTTSLVMGGAWRTSMKKSTTMVALAPRNEEVDRGVQESAVDPVMLRTLFVLAVQITEPCMSRRYPYHSYYCPPRQKNAYRSGVSRR